MKDKDIKSRYIENKKKKSRKKLPELIDNEDSIWLNRDQAAKIAGVHKNTIIAWNKSGFLPFNQNGRIVRIKFTDLKEALEKTNSKEDFEKKYNELREKLGLVDYFELPSDWFKPNCTFQESIKR